MELWDYFHGPNAGYVLELYEQYRQNPDRFDPHTRAFFEQLPNLLEAEQTNGHQVQQLTEGGAPMSAPTTLEQARKIMGVVNYANAIRESGHFAAQLDPLGGSPPGNDTLQPAYHGITEDDLRQLPAELIGGPLSVKATNAYEAVEALKQVYCGSIGYDYDHIRIETEREWLQHVAEQRFFHPGAETPGRALDGVGLLHRLTEVEVFEDFLQKTFRTKYRFSIEGLDMLVPMLDEAIRVSAEKRHMQNILIGMAHRGRLNVMAHVLRRPYAQILAEFIDDVTPSDAEMKLGWTGDVKYHRGQEHEITNAAGERLKIAIPPNPSHLEAVNPICVGMARAAGTRVDQPGTPTFDPDVTMTILIHGDAAFAAQGVVAETLNLSQLPGYATGGTVHIIANNQIGFTTDRMDARSTIYASDLAKGFKVPVVHVNADDPIACIEVARLAADYVANFDKDFVIDLIGYRRYGHNELDEPRFTQPLMYELINAHPRVREMWAGQLMEQGLLTEDEVQSMAVKHRQTLQETYNTLREENARFDDEDKPVPTAPGTAARTATNIAAEDLLAMNDSLREAAGRVTLLSRLRKNIDGRRDAVASGEKAIDWATAEEMALAAVLAQGTAVRLTGQDVERGTFSHRHAVLTDLDTGEEIVPLQRLAQAQAAFEIHNSPLSEVAALGFEYGYNAQAPDRLVMWEAQFGDFVNNAQVIVDEFITAARAKWGETPSLVLLLPHGYEGKGPDHSSGRLERFLQLAAKTNIRIAYPTLPAQYYHLLVRQARLLKNDPLPLVVMTPKSLLRNPLVVSALGDLAEGGWEPVLDDPRSEETGERERITRLVLCSGKFFYDLTTDDRRDDPDFSHMAVVRLEQLYPFPNEALAEVLDRYPNLEHIVWAQEEPKNMGAWDALHWRLERLLKQMDRPLPVNYVGRRRISSPAEGSQTLHNINQAIILKEAYTWHPEGEK